MWINQSPKANFRGIVNKLCETAKMIKQNKYKK